MKIEAILFLILLALSNITTISISQLPSNIQRGFEAQENPEISYSDFQTSKTYYKTNYGVNVEFEHLSTYTRPTSFLSSGVYESKRLKYYSYFASFGYCSPDKIGKGQCCSNIFNNQKGISSPNGWTLIDYGQSSGSDTDLVFTDKKNTYAILKSDIFKKVVITFPGTKDQIIQLGSEMINSKLIAPDFKTLKGDIKINKYFNMRAQALISVIFSSSNIEKMKLKSGYQVIFTGHSLGGAMAATSLLYAIDRGYITRGLNKPVLITYGQPRTGNEQFALLVNNYAEVIYRNVNSMDIVTQIPLYKDGHRHTEGRININGDENTYSFVKQAKNYNVNQIVDSQEYDVLQLIKYLTTNIKRHTNYYGKQISHICDN